MSYRYPNYLRSVAFKAEPLSEEEIWVAVEPLLLPEPPKPKGGRPRVPDRLALRGMVYVLRHKAPWETLPRSLGCGSGLTCLRRFKQWEAAGVWDRIREGLYARYEPSRFLWLLEAVDLARDVTAAGRLRSRRQGRYYGRYKRRKPSSQEPGALVWR